MRYLAADAHGDMDVVGECGYGESEEPYALMDAMITMPLQQENIVQIQVV